MSPHRAYRPVLEQLEERHLLSVGFGLVNLASDVPGVARFTDPNLVNPWGIASSPTGPFWFAENGGGVSDVLDGRGEPFSLVVTLPSTAAGSRGAPTGIVFNAGAGFVISANGVSAPSRFLFASEDGTISGWTPVLEPTRALLAVDNSSTGAVYVGLALAADPAGHSFLYAADFGRGAIDVFDQDFRPVLRPGAFQDPDLPDGFEPFNVQDVNGLLFVTYARQAADGEDGAGAGGGFIDVYDTDGRLVRRFASAGALDSPWGLALAPADFGPFGGALLIGNNGDGHVSAYDPESGAFLGELEDGNGNPIAIPGLWGLTFGNGHVGGDPDTLFFVAGVDDERHGLFGAIQAPNRRGADTAGAGAFDPKAPGEPGDYPLPPRGGPAFQAGEDVPTPDVDLLPSRESSLVLIPTLSAASPPGQRIEAPVVAAPIAGGFGGPAFAAPFARGGHHGAGAPEALLDPSARRDVPPKPRVQWLASALYAVGFPRRPSEDFDAETGDLLSVGYVQRLEALSGEERQDPETPPHPSQPAEVLTAAPSDGRAGSADERAAPDGRGETRGRRWIRLIEAACVLGIPTLWACWVSRRTCRHRRSTGGNLSAVSGERLE